MIKNGTFKIFNFLKYLRTHKLFSTLQDTIIPKPVKQKKEVTVDVNDYFMEIDLRVGKIVEIEEKKDSENIFCMKIDLGEGTLRDIGSGIRKYYKKEEILDSKVIIFSNLKPRKLGGFLSNGMILCADNDSEIEILRAPSEVNCGEKLQMENFPIIDPEVVVDVLNDKKLKKYLAYFKVDDNYCCTFNGNKFIVKGNYIKLSKLKNVKIC